MKVTSTVDTEPISIVFVGSGRVAVNLALGLTAVGHRVLGALVRDIHSDNARRFQHLAGPVALLPINSLSGTHSSGIATDWLKTADALVISVSDEAIAEISKELAAMLPQAVPICAFHTSGSRDSEVLAPLRASGLACASMHPLQTFTETSVSPQCFTGIAFGLDGDDQAVDLATQWARQLGGYAIQVPAVQRPAYHAAAVLASNAVLALLQVATQLLPEAAKKQPDNPLLPLLQGALDNVRRMGLPQSLTGPIDRGDWKTVAIHLQTLKRNTTAYDVYLSLAVATVELAMTKGTLPQEQVRERRQQLRQLLYHREPTHTSFFGGELRASSNDTDFFK